MRLVFTERDLAPRLRFVEARGFLQGSAPVTPPSGPAAIDSVVVMGASIMNAAFGNDLVAPHPAASALLAAAGHALPVYGRAVSGVHVSDAVAQYTSARAAHPNALILMHLGGNNVSSGQPYPGGLANLQSGLADLLAVAAGDARFYPASISFRDYGDAAFQDPSLGSKPYNENVVIPWIAANYPHAMAPYGRPKLDFYRVTLQNFDSWLSADNVHLVSAGTIAFREWIMARVADLLSGITPPEIAERVYSPPAGHVPGALSIVNFRSTAGATVGHNNVTGAATGPVLADILDVAGNDTGAALAIAVTPGAVADSTTSPGFGAGAAGRNTAPAYAGQLLAGPITATAFYVTAAVSATFTLSGLVPGAQYEIGFVGSRSGTDTRISTLAFQGGAPVEWNATEDPVVERKATVTADGSGVISAVLAPKAGAPFAYLSGLSFRQIV